MTKGNNQMKSWRQIYKINGIEIFQNSDHRFQWNEEQIKNLNKTSYNLLTKVK